jgi:hypothetical protein
MTTMRGLKWRATRAASQRGHVRMGPWESSANRQGHGLSTCAICGAWVQVLLNPLPNEIDLGGPAVAQDCTTREAAR